MDLVAKELSEVQYINTPRLIPESALFLLRIQIAVFQLFMMSVCIKFHLSEKFFFYLTYWGMIFTSLLFIGLVYTMVRSSLDKKARRKPQRRVL